MAGELIKWNDSYNLGLEEIDEQHEYLLIIINKIWQSIIDRSDINVVLGLVEELERYTLAHFVAEETLMRVSGYPGFFVHKEEHYKFILRIAEEKNRAIIVGSMSLDLMYFLSDWLIGHIMVSDKEYAGFLKKIKSKERSLFGRLFG